MGFLLHSPNLISSKLIPPSSIIPAKKKKSQYRKKCDMVDLQSPCQFYAVKMKMCPPGLSNPSTRPRVSAPTGERRSVIHEVPTGDFPTEDGEVNTDDVYFPESCKLPPRRRAKSNIPNLPYWFAWVIETVQRTYGSRPSPVAGDVAHHAALRVAYSNLSWAWEVTMTNEPTPGRKKGEASSFDKREYVFFFLFWLLKNKSMQIKQTKPNI